MATKDYVKRGRAPKKPANNRRKTTATRSFPIKWAVIAVLLVGALGYGLYFLATSDPAPAQAPITKPKTVKPQVAKPAVVAPKQTIKPKADLPPKPEEKWRYIEELENKEVKVESKKEQKPTRPYLMQCGAYRSLEQAEERKAMIAFQGLTSQIKVAQGEKGKWHRVILGPYPQKRKAESDRNQLRRGGIEPCAIWYWEW
ncbi:SPOR domain-containing protein [Photobacterium sanguinicancri]|uniref:SPOR domain-containing protein n=1 Tax=Photobacterium sanguinicancri TaxID=875932 RepID=UPI0021C2E599|nr:SPOR domain-containing protein [Photobacterium sanguinicancri]